jgi:hypothetical protein
LCFSLRLRLRLRLCLSLRLSLSRSVSLSLSLRLSVLVLVLVLSNTRYSRAHTDGGRVVVWCGTDTTTASGTDLQNTNERFCARLR